MADITIVDLNVCKWWLVGTIYPKTGLLNGLDVSSVRLFFCFYPQVWNDIAIPRIDSHMLRLQHHARIGRQVYRKSPDTSVYSIHWHSKDEDQWKELVAVKASGWGRRKRLAQGRFILHTFRECNLSSRSNVSCGLCLWCVCLPALNQCEFITHGRKPSDHTMAVAAVASSRCTLLCRYCSLWWLGCWEAFGDIKWDIQRQGKGGW